MLRGTIGVLKAVSLAAPLCLLGLSATAVSAADLVDTLRADGRFNQLVRAIEAAELVDTLRGQEALTLFAPTDEAFAGRPPGELRDLLAGDRERLRTLLRHHVVEGRRSSDDLPPEIPSLAGEPLTIEFGAGGLTVSDGDQRATVVAGDIEADDGLIHAIDGLLVPSGLTRPAPESVAEQPQEQPQPQQPQEEARQEARQEEAQQEEPEATVTVVPPPAAAPAEPEEVEQPEPQPQVTVTEPEPQPQPQPQVTQPAQPEPRQPRQEPQPVQQARLTEGEPVPPAEAREAPPVEVASFETLTDRTVRSSDGEVEGRVADLIFSRETGEIELVIVEYGGILGLGRKSVAVPWQGVRFDDEADQLIIAMSRAELEEAPAFDYDALDTERYAQYRR